MNIKQKIIFENKIAEIKRRISDLGNVRSGSISTQYNVCGKPNCACKDKENPKKHGPYYQLSYYNDKSRHTTSFVKRENVSVIQEEVENNKTLKVLIKELVKISTEFSNLKISS